MSVTDSETQTRARSSNPEYLPVRTPASLFNTDFEDANLHRRQRVTHH
jgi:hypothetical protein